MNQNEFPRFWYESNNCWGFVRNIQELYHKFQLSVFDNLEDFLNNSKQCFFDVLNFGTRREHSTEITLKDFLIKHNCYEEFIKYANKNIKTSIDG